MLSLHESQSLNMDNKASQILADKINIKSRFGEINADPAKSIYFPKGLYGFQDNLHFTLANFPTIRPDLEQFKVLQCLNDHDVSFPVLPVAFNNSFIDEADMKECIGTVEVKEENFAMLLIVSSEKQKDGSYALYINTKAPVIIDTSLQMAIQYVFTNNKYLVKQPLDTRKV